MPAGINQVIRERRNAIKTVWDVVKSIDTNVEALQRLLKRLMALRRRVPTEDDFVRIIGMIRGILDNVAQADNVMKDVVRVFGSDYKPSQRTQSAIVALPRLGEGSVIPRRGKLHRRGDEFFDTETGEKVWDTSDGPLPASISRKYGFRGRKG